MNEQEILERGKKVRKFLEEQGGYWAFAPEESMQIGPEPFLLNNLNAYEARQHGVTIFRFWSQALEILLASLKGDLPLWIAKSIEGPLTKQQRDWQLMVCAGKKIPYLARMDCSSLWFPVEIQERLGFLGGCSSWHQANDKAGYPEGIKLLGGGDIPMALARAFRRITGLPYPHVLLVSPKGYLDEQAFLKRTLWETQEIRAMMIDRDELLAGIGLTVKNNRIMVDGQRIDLIYRRELNAATLAETEAGLSILKSYLAGGVAIEPPLNMLYDCKSPMAWVHHPETKRFFSEDVQRLIPQTVLLPLSNNEVFDLGGVELTMTEILDLPNEKRRFVMKYAGPSIEYGFGGRAVYSLTGSHKQAGGIYNDARDEISRGHPWVIQIQDQEKFQVNWLDKDSLVREQMYARLLFYYDRDNGLFAGQANFNKNWKVAGNKTTVFSVICQQTYAGGG